MSYQSGETIRLKAAITDSTGAAVDPTTITITIENVSGKEVVSAANMIKSAAGSYYYDYAIPSINIADIGTYTYKTTATGSGGRITIVKDSFEIEESI